MRTFWKVFAALALMLPLGAFVAGTLVASAADDTQPRDTLIIEEPATVGSATDPSPGAGPTSPTSPTGGPSEDSEPEDDTPEVDVAHPTPGEVHVDSDDRDDDHSGPGGGGDDDHYDDRDDDDHSGSGGGGDDDSGDSDDDGGHGGGDDD